MLHQLSCLTKGHKTILLMFACLLLAVAARPAAADGDDPGKLDSAVNSLAKDLADFLGDEDSSTVSVGAFTGQPQLAASAGTAIKNKLVDELKGMEIEHKLRAKIGCKGEYFYDDEEGIVLLTMKAMDGSREVGNWEEKIYDVADMASLLGLSGSTPVDGTPAEQREQLKETITDPQVNTAVNESSPPPAGASGDAVPETLLKPTAGSLYALEILVAGPDGSLSPLPVVADEGLAFVDLAVDQAYVIRVINNSPHLAAVRISIDGLNLFEFSQIPQFRDLGYVLVPPSPKGSLIKGWFINNGQADRFLVSDYAESERGKRDSGVLKSDDELATITAQFSVAVPPGQPFPADEPGLRNFGTKRGPSIAVNYGTKPAKVGQVREFVSVRYARSLPPPN